MTEKLPNNLEDGKNARSLITRIALASTVPLLAKGLPVPGKKFLLAKLSQAEIAQLNRTKLAYEIKTAEYKLRFGPIWVRMVVQKIREYWLVHRFWIFVSLKIAFSLIILILPAFVFWIYRLFLPFPEILDQSGTIHQKERALQFGSWVTERPYSNKGLDPTNMITLPRLETLDIAKEQIIQINTFNQTNRFTNTQNISNSQESQPTGKSPKREGNHLKSPTSGNTTAQNMVLSVWNRSREETETRSAYWLDPSTPLVLKNWKKNAADIFGGNSLKGEFLVFSLSSQPVKCRFDLYDSSGRVLFSTEKSAIQASANNQIFSNFSKISDWYQNLSPRFPRLGSVRLWEDYSFSIDHLPDELRFSIRELDPEGRILEDTQEHETDRFPQSESISRGIVQAAEPLSMQAAAAGQPTPHNCMAAVSNPVFHKRVLSHNLRHSIALVVLDGVSAAAARDPLLMPHFARMQQESINFDANFSNHTDPNAALRALLQGDSTEFESLEIQNSPGEGGVSSTHGVVWKSRQTPSSSLFSQAAQRGYLTAYFGDSEEIFPTNRLGPSDIPDSVSGSTAPHHVGVGAAQAAKEWLKENAQFPYFIVIRLSDIKDRLMPPWRYLDIGKFLIGPFGFAGRSTRYEAMLRYMDGALNYVVDSLKSANTETPVDVLISGSSSLQFQTLETNFAHDRESASSIPKGASFRMGKALLPDNLHVPLSIVQLNQQAGQQNWFAKIPNPNDSLHSHLSTHKLLTAMLNNSADMLKKIQSEGTKATIAKGQKTIGFVSQRNDSSAIEFLAIGDQVFPDQIFVTRFPYNTKRINVQKPQEIWGDYNPGTGSFQSFQTQPKETIFERSRSSQDRNTALSEDLKPTLIFNAPFTESFLLHFKNTNNLVIGWRTNSDAPPLQFEVLENQDTISIRYSAANQDAKILQSTLATQTFQLLVRGYDPRSSPMKLVSHAAPSLCNQPLQQKSEPQALQPEFDLSRFLPTHFFDNLPLCAFELRHTLPKQAKPDQDLERTIRIEYGWP